MDLFLLLISQMFDAFVENFNLFLIILDILIEFLNLFLEFLLLTRFKFKYERSASQSPGVGDGRPPEDRDRQSPRRGRI